MPWATPLGFILTGANVSDFDQARPLLKAHLQPNAFAIMDKGYDRDAIRAYVNQLGATAVIALHPSRSQKPAFDEPLYREPPPHRKSIRQTQTIPPHLHSLRKTALRLRRHALTRLHPPLAPILTRHPLVGGEFSLTS
jgi:hypothetical protein